MYRIARKMPQILLSRASPSTRVVRNLAAVKKGGMSWGGQVAASTTAITVSLVGTTLVVANSNEEFRAKLEGVPGAADVLDTILGGRIKAQEFKTVEDFKHLETEKDIPQEAVKAVKDVPATVGKLEEEVVEESTKEEGEQSAIESTITETESEVLKDEIETPKDGAKDIPELIHSETDSSKEVVTEEPTSDIITEVKVEEEAKKDELALETPIKKEELADEIIPAEEIITNDSILEVKSDEVITEAPIAVEVTKDEVEQEVVSDKVEETLEEEVVTEVPVDEVIPESLVEEVVTDEISILPKVDDVVAELETVEETVTDEVVKDAKTEELLSKDEVSIKSPSDEVTSSAPIDDTATVVKVEKEVITIEAPIDKIVKDVQIEDAPNDTVQVSEPDSIPEVIEPKPELKENIAVIEEDIPEAESQSEKSDGPISSIAEAGAVLAAVLVISADVAADIVLAKSQEKEVPVKPLVSEEEEGTLKSEELPILEQIEPEAPIEQIQETVISVKAVEDLNESADKVVTEDGKVDVLSTELTKETLTEDLPVEENLIVDESSVKQEDGAVIIITEENPIEEIVTEEAQIIKEELVAEEQKIVQSKESIPDIEIKNEREELVSTEPTEEKITEEKVTESTEPEAKEDVVKEDFTVQKEEEPKVAEKEDVPLEIITEVSVPTIESDTTGSKLDDAFDKLGVKVDEPEEPIVVEDKIIEHSALLNKSSLEIESKDEKVDAKGDIPPLAISVVASKEEDLESGLPTFVEKVINPDVQLSLMNGAASHVNGVADHEEEVEGAAASEEAKSSEDHEQINQEEIKIIEEPKEDKQDVIKAKEEVLKAQVEIEKAQEELKKAVGEDEVKEAQEELKEAQEELIEAQEELKAQGKEVPLLLEESIEEKSTEDVKTENVDEVIITPEEKVQHPSDDTTEHAEVKIDTPVEIEEAEEEKAIIEEIPIVHDDKDIMEESSGETIAEDITVEAPIIEELVEAKEDSIADKPLEELAVEELVAVVQDTTQELDNLQETLIEEMEKTAGLAMKVLKLQEDIVKQQRIDREKYSNELELQKQEMLKDIRKRTEELLVQKEGVEHMYVEELEGMKKAYEDTLAKKEEEYQTKFAEKDEEYQKNLERQKEELENLMKKHIGRQAAAHHEHLQEELQTLKTEQERHYSLILTASLDSAQTAYETNLAGLQGRLDGIEASLKDRGNADTEVVVAQRLWLACRDLVDAVSGGEGKLPAWEQGVQTVGDHILNVQAVKEGDEFVAAVLSSLPSGVQARGVYSEAALKYRFNQVEKAASRVALVGEHGGTPLQHLVSALSSMLMVNTVDHHEAEFVASEMSQMELIWRARYCVDNGDMGMAVQYMNQLKGDAALVARDWVEETRMLLETQLAASALMSYATSVAMEILPHA